MDTLDNHDQKGLEDAPDPSGGDGEPYVCLSEDREPQVWTVLGHSHGMTTSHLSICHFAFSLVGANFFPVPSNLLCV